MEKVGIIIDERFILLESDPLSPENPDRILPLFHYTKNATWLKKLPSRMAEFEVLLLIHDENYIKEIKELSKKGGRLSLDTWIPKGGYEIAALAVGCCIEAVESVLEERIKKVFVIVRPPGHHAQRNEGKGFCIFNNVAIAAKYAIEKGGLRKVLIVDWDVHHGNGTQEAFYLDPKVLYFSIHQHPLFPETGYFDEIGEGEGKGYTINVPLPLGCNDSDYGNIFRHILLPVMEEFQPQLILVSAGFDPHHLDPLGEMHLTERGFWRLGDLLIKKAEEICEGKIIFVLEGGHHPEAVFRSSLEILKRCEEPNESLSSYCERQEDENFYKIRPFITSVREVLQGHWRF